MNDLKKGDRAIVHSLPAPYARRNGWIVSIDTDPSLFNGSDKITGAPMRVILCDVTKIGTRERGYIETKFLRKIDDDEEPAIDWEKNGK